MLVQQIRNHELIKADYTKETSVDSMLKAQVVFADIND